MASCDATGPCGMVCTTPSSVVTLVYGLRFWITPCEQSKSAATTEIGSSTYSVPRMKSTQKLPRVLVECREKPLTTAQALGIQQEPLLEALDQVGELQSDRAEGEHRPGVARPVLLRRLLDAAELVDGDRKSTR